MNEDTNVQVVQRAFQAFGSGDIPTVLGLLTDDVVWHTHGPPDVLPWAGRREGQEQVGQFFGTLAELLEFQRFEPREFIAQGDRVAVLGGSQITIRRNNRIAEPDWVMVFRIRDGQVAEYHYFEDTAATAAAMQG
jgi:ketosteroid isomerase-like protein